MSGNKAGGIKGMKTIISKHGRTEDGRSALHVKVGTLGGKAIHNKPRGFAANKEVASAAGKVGGSVSRRRSAK